MSTCKRRCTCQCCRENRKKMRRIRLANPDAVALGVAMFCESMGRLLVTPLAEVVQKGLDSPHTEDGFLVENNFIQ